MDGSRGVKVFSFGNAPCQTGSAATVEGTFKKVTQQGRYVFYNEIQATSVTVAKELLMRLLWTFLVLGTLAIAAPSASAESCYEDSLDKVTRDGEILGNSLHRQEPCSLRGGSLHLA
jgi:hypothetical protein